MSEVSYVLQLACATCMHAMRPPQLTAAIRTPRRISRALPLGPYNPLAAAAAAALSDRTIADDEARLSHVTLLHPDPFSDSIDTGTSTAQTSPRQPTHVGAPVATLSSTTLHILQLRDAPSTASALAPVVTEVLARLPLSAVCSTAVDDQWLEVVFTALANHQAAGDDAVAVPDSVEHGSTLVRKDGGPPASAQRAESQQAAAPALPLESASTALSTGGLDDGGTGGSGDTDVERTGSGESKPPPPRPTTPPQAVGPGEGLGGAGLPFRVLRVRCADADGAAALRAAVARRQATVQEMLRRRGALAHVAADGHNDAVAAGGGPATEHE